MLRFNDIADRVLDYSPNADLQLLQKAYVFSAKVHEGQERLSGEPYLVHPLEVAGILGDLRMDDVTIAAALLHDTLEDTLTSREELERVFGEKVAFIVDGLTKIARIEFTSARERQAENFRKMLIAMSTDIRILLIKLADRLHNMRTLQHLEEEAAQRVAQETMEIYVPLAHRLGIRWMMQELEEYSFRALHPQAVEEISRQLTGSRDERERYVHEMIGSISTILEQGEIHAEVKGRLKELASIHRKMHSQGLDVDQIYDVLAFRVVIEGPSDSCYTALGLIHSEWRPVPSRFKDYLGNPKTNGYRSLHTTVIGPYGERMEVQIRTQEMDRDAEYGIAAHWKYKEGRQEEESDEDQNRFAWLRQLLEWQRELSDPHEFLDTVKMDLFPGEIFVFTPRGEVINLPRRASAIDFAYAIHSEVGNRCAGARVNGKMVPLRHTLLDGDTVEIVTNQNQFPRKDWLEFVVSGKARSHIRHSIRANERERSVGLGRDILVREFRKVGLSLSKLTQSGELHDLAASQIKGGKEDDLFAAVSYGKIPPSRLVAALKGEHPEEPAPEEITEPLQDRLRSLFRKRPESPEGGSSGILVGGEADVMVRFGGCCDPLPGDDVLGFVTRGRGVTVHSRGCPRVFELDPERRIEVQWDAAKAVPRKVTIRITSRDRTGILAKITNAISAAGINIAAVKVNVDAENRSVQSYELWVGDTRTLSAVMKEISRVKGVLSVDRVRG
ncbi:MAG: bifunctional (p)ppGpp synthetase/guanosine-3',5'-bis(diphosphate) 3'-pyrophosphohydrolase [Myxococcota bacterium]|nr:bifunctional (p)ppGpp synthetase/guanosine-3',5'-bis(diphosphate) 3'-pyrophosphohydrolase [Myxococcota bacterium]